MTKEELKEAIASTIVENNQKGITATALANLLNEIVDAVGEGGGNAGGGGLMIDPAGIEGVNEHNARIRQVLIEGINTGVAYPVTMTGFESGAVISYTVFMYGLVGELFILQFSELPDMAIFLNEDGSLTVEGE